MLCRSWHSSLRVSGATVSLGSLAGVWGECRGPGEAAGGGTAEARGGGGLSGGSAGVPHRHPQATGRSGLTGRQEVPVCVYLLASSSIYIYDPVSLSVSLSLSRCLARREARAECDEVRSQSEASLEELRAGLAASREAQRQQAERHWQEENRMREKR